MKFFDAIKNFFIKFFKKAPTVLQHVSTVLSFVAPITERILQTFDPTVAPEAHQIIAEVQADLATAGVLVSQAHGGSVPETLSNTLTAVTTNLQALLTAGHIKDPHTLATVTADVNLIDGELQAVLGLLTPAK